MKFEGKQQLNPNQLLQLASRAIQSNKIPEAEEIIKAIFKQDDKFGPAYNHLGWIYANIYNDLKQAEEHYKKAMEYHPDFPPTYYNYSLLLNVTNRFDELKEVLEKALKVPAINRAKIHGEYAVMHELMQDYDLAIESCREAMKHSLVNEEVDKQKKAIERCEKKREILKKD